MNDDQFRQAIMQHLDALASKLNTTAAHMWGVLIRQARIEAVTDSIELALFIAASVVLARFAWKAFHQEYTYKHTGYRDEWTSDTMTRHCLAIAASVVLIPLIIVSISLFETLGTVLMNPEYWALQRIVSGL